jgi:hypothetical protein
MEPSERQAQLRRDKSDLLTEIALTKRTYRIAAGADYDTIVEQCTLALVHARTPSARQDVRSCLVALSEMGVRLLPQEPTPEMLEALQIGGVEGYKAMLAAAPQLTP